MAALAAALSDAQLQHADTEPERGRHGSRCTQRRPRRWRLPCLGDRQRAGRRSRSLPVGVPTTTRSRCRGARTLTLIDGTERVRRTTRRTGHTVRHRTTATPSGSITDPAPIPVTMPSTINRDPRTAATTIRAVLPADASNVLAAASRPKFLTVSKSPTRTESPTVLARDGRKGTHRLPATFNI